MLKASLAEGKRQRLKKGFLALELHFAKLQNVFGREGGTSSGWENVLSFLSRLLAVGSPSTARLFSTVHFLVQIAHQLLASLLLREELCFVCTYLN